MSVWLDLGRVEDFVHGGDSDSGFALDVCCPKCKGSHLVTLSSIGRFLFRCPDGAVVSGSVEEWKQERRLIRKEPCQN